MQERPRLQEVLDAIIKFWSMDFMSNQLGGGRIFRRCNVRDDFNREGLGIEADLLLQAAR